MSLDELYLYNTRVIITLIFPCVFVNCKKVTLCGRNMRLDCIKQSGHTFPASVPGVLKKHPCQCFSLAFPGVHFCINVWDMLFTGIFVLRLFPLCVEDTLVHVHVPLDISNTVTVLELCWRCVRGIHCMKTQIPKETIH